MEENESAGGKILPVPSNQSGEMPKEVQILIRSVVALVMFILGFNLSRSAFFREFRLFGVPYLADLIISSLSAFIGFFYVPRILFIIKRSIENLIVTTVYDIVNHFWEQQTKRIQEQRRLKQQKKEDETAKKIQEEQKGALLLDTSALVDGRFLEIVKLHFIDNTVIVPQYVIDELHALSDSKDDLKRKKGRRGLDTLKDLKKRIRVFIPEIRNSGEGVDKMLVKYAKENRYKLVTLDFNLNKVAEVNGVRVLNINDLSNSLKTVMLPGEEIEVKIIHVGKEKQQGVGYLQDGTMLVVEGAKEKVEQVVRAKVQKVIQSPAGKIIFSEIINRSVEHISEPVQSTQEAGREDDGGEIKKRSTESDI